MYLEKNVSLLPLEMLHAGEEARIVEVEGDAIRIHQLAEIGLRQGCTIRMVRYGRPSILVVDGHRLSIRLNGEVSIFVSPLASSRAG